MTALQTNQRRYAHRLRFIYLNRVCFNGLYRVNLRGEFNVPLGSKKEVRFELGYLRRVAVCLRGANIVSADFETLVDKAGANDFVFIDPPYTVAHNNNGFIKYNDVLFSWEDQVRLALSAKRAARRGALVLISNADHSEVRNLYGGLPFCRSIERASVLSGTPRGRRQTTEALFSNFDLFAL